MSVYDRCAQKKTRVESTWWRWWFLKSNNHAGLMGCVESEDHGEKLAEGRKWHSCFKYCQGVTQQSAWPPLTPLEQTGQLPGRSQCEVVRRCKNTFAQLSLTLCLKLRWLSVDEAELGSLKNVSSAPEGNKGPFLCCKLEWMAEWKRLTDRWTSLMFIVSGCHCSSGLYRTDLLISIMSLMTIIRQSSSHVNQTLTVNKRGYYFQQSTSDGFTVIATFQHLPSYFKNAIKSAKWLLIDSKKEQFQRLCALVDMKDMHQ